MKIVCMDCQTESHVEVELLKDKKRFECEHCAKNRLDSSMNQTREQIHLPASDILDFYSVSGSEILPERGITLFDEAEVLEIPLLPAPPETAQSPEMDEIISAPFYDLKSVPPEEDSNDVFIDDTAKKEEIFAPESPRQLSSAFVPTTEAFTQTPSSSNLRQPVEETFHEMPDKPKGVKMMTAKTPIFIGVAAMFVLFIALGDKIIRPAIKASPETENSRPLAITEQEIKPVPSVATSAQPEPAITTQTEPAQPVSTPDVRVIETKPADVMPPAKQPPVAAAEGQFAVQLGSHNDVGLANEQAEKLRAAGFEPRVVSVDIPKRGRWYRVQSGSFSNRAEANRYGSQIVTKGAAENFVIAGL
ncbi:MAG: SPOR domain-containing protein [Acidobacteria bacterium]|jgi:cell division septation protein DedD/DNA-directed RNA polymerase subunit RPC12/RpoP|nr:SPOR domain-containing protein [Acidobacteriota bacterium]